MFLSDDQIIDIWRSLPLEAPWPYDTDTNRIVYKSGGEGLSVSFNEFKEIIMIHSKYTIAEEIFLFMHIVPLERVPLHINNEGLKPYAEWRLKNGI